MSGVRVPPGLPSAGCSKRNMSNGQVKAENNTALNAIKWLLVTLIVGVGVYGNNFYANDFSIFERTLALLPMAAVAIFIGLRTVQGAAFSRLVKESRSEIRRVVWPSRQETNQTTLIVVAVVLIMALMLWAMDWVLVRLVSLIIG